MDIQPTTFKKMLLVSQEYLADLEDFKRNYMQGYTENNGNNSNMQVDDEVYAENEDENLNQQIDDPPLSQTGYKCTEPYCKAVFDSEEDLSTHITYGHAKPSTSGVNNVQSQQPVLEETTNEATNTVSGLIDDILNGVTQEQLEKVAENNGYTPEEKQEINKRFEIPLIINQNKCGLCGYKPREDNPSIIEHLRQKHNNYPQLDFLIAQHIRNKNLTRSQDIDNMYKQKYRRSRGTKDAWHKLRQAHNQGVEVKVPIEQAAIVDIPRKRRKVKVPIKPAVIKNIARKRRKPTLLNNQGVKVKVPIEPAAIVDIPRKRHKSALLDKLGLKNPNR